MDIYICFNYIYYTHIIYIQCTYIISIVVAETRYCRTEYYTELVGKLVSVGTGRTDSALNLSHPNNFVNAPLDHLSSLTLQFGLF